MASQVWAQPGKELPSEQVEVIKVFEAQLAESNKIGVNPELPPSDTTIKRQNYELPLKSLEVEYPAPRIRPVTYKSDEEVPDVYKAYAKLGAGLPNSIYGEGAFNTHVKTQKSTSYDVGVDLLHHSANFSNDEVENQRFGLTKAGLDGTYYFDKGYAVSSNLGYSSNKVHYYGYNFDKFFDPDQSFPPEAVQQVFSTFDFGAKIFNGVQTAGDLNYQAGIDFYSLGDSYAARETGVDLKAGITKWINDRHSFDLGLRTDFTWYDDTLELAQTLHNYTLSPAFTFHADAFKVKLGGRLVSSDDEFFPFPDVEVVVNLTGNELAFYAGVEGDMKKNTFRSLSNYNPYIYTRFQDGQDPTLRNTKYYNVYAGIRGNLKIFEYTAQAGYKPTNDLALFKTRFDSQDAPIREQYSFDVEYADANIIYISASVKATPVKGVEVTGTINQNIYDMQDCLGCQVKAWHLPAFTGNFQAAYTTSDNKLKAKATLYLENGLVSNNSPIPSKFDNLNGLFDLSLGAEYWVAKNFGIFLDVNNLLNNKRQRWRNYPTYGTNVLAGVTARF
jgi:hypothetical protein